jgi:hypothetical protein
MQRYNLASSEGLLLVGKVQNLDRNSPSEMPSGERIFVPHSQFISFHSAHCLAKAKLSFMIA